MKMTEKEEETLGKRFDELYEEGWQFHHLTTVASCIEKVRLLLEGDSFYDKNNCLDCKMIEKWGRDLLKNVEKFEKELEKQKQRFQKSFARLENWAAKRQKKK